MRNEVDKEVMQVINDDLSTRGKQNIYEVLARLGVRDAYRGSEKIYDYVWEVPGGVPIFTVWAEFVCFHPVAKRMFYVESLNVKTTLMGGGAMDAGQLKRTQDRRRYLTKVKSGDSFIVVLQTNMRSIEELERNVTAKPLDRIKDSNWHVARWDDVRSRAILVRGQKDWAPTDAEVDEYVAHRRLRILTPGPEPAPSAPPNVETVDDLDGDQDVVPGLRFPDQEHRDRVEAAAVEHMMAHFRTLGLTPESVESENRGYDIDVKDASGNSVHLVEVKGTSAPAPGFFLTANELACSEREASWRLAVVTSALSAPDHQIYDSARMMAAFAFKPLAWRCDVRQFAGAKNSESVNAGRQGHV